jgi:hypothetical protein
VIHLICNVKKYPNFEMMLGITKYKLIFFIKKTEIIKIKFNIETKRQPFISSFIIHEAWESTFQFLIFFSFGPCFLNI